MNFGKNELLTFRKWTFGHLNDVLTAYLKLYANLQWKKTLKQGFYSLYNE